jgi:hypothetical protein
VAACAFSSSSWRKCHHHRGTRIREARKRFEHAGLNPQESGMLGHHHGVRSEVIGSVLRQPGELARHLGDGFKHHAQFVRDISRAAGVAGFRHYRKLADEACAAKAQIVQHAITLERGTLGKLLELDRTAEIAGLGLVADVKFPMSVNAIAAHVEFRRQGIDTGAASAQQFETPAIGVSAYPAIIRHQPKLDLAVAFHITGYQPVQRSSRTAGHRADMKHPKVWKVK